MIRSDTVLNFKGIEALKGFINKNIYEEFLKGLMTQIPGISNNITRIQSQSNSEGDFYDPETNSIYEATLLINENVMLNIINNSDYLFSDELYKKRFNDTISVFIDSLKRKQNKQMTIVLFNIFPDIFSKFQGSVTEIYFQDETDLIFDEIKNNYPDLVSGKNILIISYNDDNSFYARTLFKRKDDLVFIYEYNEDIFPFKIISKEISIDNNDLR